MTKDTTYMGQDKPMKSSVSSRIAGDSPTLRELGIHGSGTLTMAKEANKTPSDKLTNPKDIIGSDKLPLHLWPTTATAMGCLGFLEGALKYGRSNFRAVGVRSSIYYDAARRHLDAWWEGEDNAPDSGLPHLAHLLACVAILVDAQACNKLNDDRMYPGGYREFADDLTKEVRRLKDKYADTPQPEHYTIQKAP